MRTATSIPARSPPGLHVVSAPSVDADADSFEPVLLRQLHHRDEERRGYLVRRDPFESEARTLHWSPSIESVLRPSIGSVLQSWSSHSSRVETDLLMAFWYLRRPPSGALPPGVFRARHAHLDGRPSYFAYVGKACKTFLRGQYIRSYNVDSHACPIRTTPVRTHGASTTIRSSYEPYRKISPLRRAKWAMPWGVPAELPTTVSGNCERKTKSSRRWSGTPSCGSCPTTDR